MEKLYGSIWDSTLFSRVWIRAVSWSHIRFNLKTGWTVLASKQQWRSCATSPVKFSEMPLHLLWTHLWHFTHSIDTSFYKHFFYTHCMDVFLSSRPDAYQLDISWPLSFQHSLEDLSLPCPSYISLTFSATTLLCMLQNKISGMKHFSNSPSYVIVAYRKEKQSCYTAINKTYNLNI